jgi:hypothetical protein
MPSHWQVTPVVMTTDRAVSVPPFPTEPQSAIPYGGAPHHVQRDDIHEAFLTLGCAIICWRRLRNPLTRQDR